MPTMPTTQPSPQQAARNAVPARPRYSAARIVATLTPTPDAPLTCNWCGTTFTASRPLLRVHHHDLNTTATYSPKCYAAAVGQPFTIIWSAISAHFRSADLRDLEAWEERRGRIFRTAAAHHYGTHPERPTAEQLAEFASTTTWRAINAKWTKANPRPNRKPRRRGTESGTIPQPRAPRNNLA